MTATTTQARIGVLGGVFAAAFLVVVGHLWWVMVKDHEVWARRSHENRWSFQSVPSQRGSIFDRFGTVLVRDEPTTQPSAMRITSAMVACFTPVLASTGVSGSVFFTASTGSSMTKPAASTRAF